MKSKQKVRLILYVIPAFVIYAVFYLFPIVQSIIYSTFEWNGIIMTDTFINVENYKGLFQDEWFLGSIKNNIMLISMVLVIQIPFALLLAILVSTSGKRIKGLGIFRFCFFLPMVASASALALMWKMIYEPNIGLINNALQAIGMGKYVRPWLAMDNSSIFALIPEVWQGVGFYFVVFCAAITGIPTEILESASLDGVNFIQRIRFIILPMIKKIFVSCIILGAIGTIRSFGFVFLLTGGGPVHKTELMATYMYNTAFNSYKYGYASAIATMIFVFSLLFTVLIKGISKCIMKGED